MRLPSRRELCAVLGSGTLFGCSLIYDLSPDQCGTSSDCASFGQGYVCEEGMCKLSDVIGGDCTTSGDCLAEDPNTPRACIETTPRFRTCVPLTTEECPRILPTGGSDGDGELWRSRLSAPGSIVIGAFGFLPPEGYSKFTRNYDLALTELENYAGGVRGKDATTRPIVAVVCNNDYVDPEPVLAGVRHLVEDVRVPAIVAAIRSGDLQDAFSQTRQSEVNPDVFFMSPNSSTEGLAQLPDDNLVWNILPNGGEVAKAYGPLLTRTIDYLHSSMRVPAGEVIKVAVVYATDQRLLIDMKAALPDLLNFNGKDYATNSDDGNLEEIQVTSSYEDPTAPLTTQIDRIVAFAPHVVIELGANELFTTLIPHIEMRWAMEAPADQARPFYLLSPYHYEAGPALGQAVANNRMPDALNMRMAGVNYAAAPTEFKGIVDAWHEAYANMWPDDPDTTGYENYYDAPWYVIGALAATTPTTDTFSGLNLAQGMLRLMNPNGPQYAVGHDDINDVIDDLADAKSIEYVGTMGRPTFDATGAREGSGSVWCVTAAAQQLPDVLYVDPGSDPDSTADDILVGDGFANCNPDF